MPSLLCVAVNLVFGSLLLRRSAWLAGVFAVLMVASLLQVPGLAAAPFAQADERAPEAAVTEEQAVKAARQSGEPVEVLAERGESRTVRALPNGRMEIEQRLRPIRARQGGGWADIDTGLRREGDVVVAAATTVGLKFSGGGNGPMAEMTRAGRKLALTWPQPLPEPVLDGDTAVYAGVAGPDVDLRVRALADGFAHVLVIKTAEAAQDPRVATLSLAMSAGRLAVTEEQDSGVLKAADPGSGAVVFEAPAPLMWDSSQAAPAGSRSSGQTAELDEEPAAGAKTAPVEVAVGDGSLTLTPDQGLLTAPDTTFPVYIDPVWTTSKASSWGMVSSGYPAQSYYKFAGKSTEGVGRCEVAKDPNCVKNQTKRLFYRLPLPSLKGRYIQSVQFTAFETSAYNCSNPTAVQLWRTSALQSYATWNNSSGSWHDMLAWRDVAYCSKAPVEFGGAALRSDVQGAVNQGLSSITFGLRAYSESTMDWWKRFADDAYLTIQYNNPPYKPNYKSMATTPGGLCGPYDDPVIINRVPELSGWFWDPDDEDAFKVQPQFAAYWDNGDGQGWIPRWVPGLLAPAKSGIERSLKMPDTIPQKILIGWHARAWDGEQYSPWSSTGASPACYLVRPDQTGPDHHLHRLPR
ncbi:hypothetical protein [Spirillospora sp. NPDC048819]|uniref:hypothetical protein n=1 Tax=Spirillospora sp. NPDC048819 TaxID=3155268 RepID=UPI0033FBECE6